MDGIINVYNENNRDAYDGFMQLFQRYNIGFEEINLKVMENIETSAIKIEELKDEQNQYLDCTTSRAITQKGIFACPSLCNDFRARVGIDLNDYGKKTCLDTEKCIICRATGKKMYVNDWI